MSCCGGCGIGGISVGVSVVNVGVGSGGVGVGVSVRGRCSGPFSQNFKFKECRDSLKRAEKLKKNPASGDTFRLYLC